MAMASRPSASPTPTKVAKSSSQGDKKAAAAIPGEFFASQRIAFLWSASQTALETGNVILSGIYLNKLIKFAEAKNIQINSDVAVCTSCACLMIPGATASVKLVPCESLSNANHARMLTDRNKATNIAGSSGQQLKPIRNGLIFKCKLCGNVTPVAGTQAWKSKKAKKAKVPSSAAPYAASAPNPTQAAPSAHKQSSTVMTKDPHARKVLSKEVQAKDERQKLLASMLKASTQQPAKKPSIVVGGAKAAGPPAPNSGGPAKPSAGKKSLFSFLTSL